NTTTSMGRLTLNILLSFAQFEREVIGERIRDKIAASKRKGMWMGGVPPLGSGDRRQAILARCALPDAAEPTLSRRDRSQGTIPPRRTPADHRSAAVEYGSGATCRQYRRAQLRHTQ